MAYFNNSFIEFFKGLAINNHKEWFDENRKTYEKEVKAPFKALVEDIIAEVNKLDELPIEAKNAIFRINRDIRFSKDKTPYKLNVGAAFSLGGKKSMQTPSYYLHLGIGETYFGGGVYKPDNNYVKSIRENISTNLKKFEKVANNKDLINTFGAINGEKNKIIPKEYRDIAEKQELILNKQFYVMKKYEDEDAQAIITNDDLLNIIMQHYKAFFPLYSFLKDSI